MSQYTIIFAKEGFKTSIWNFDSDQVELITGMFAAGNGILSDINYPRYDTLFKPTGQTNSICVVDSCRNTLSGLSFCTLDTRSTADTSVLTDKDPNAKYYFTTNFDISIFRKATYVLEDDIPERSINQLTNNEYGIWVKSDIKYQYDLYVCKTPYWYQGFLSLCESFQVNYKDYMYGLAFDAYGVLYSFNNEVYTIANTAIDVPDLNDVEEEEADNEKIINPYSDNIDD